MIQLELGLEQENAVQKHVCTQPTNQQVIQTYQEIGNIRKTAKKLGCGVKYVTRRVTNAGICKPSTKLNKQMLDHLDWADVSVRYTKGWGFKRLADHFGESRSAMRIALGNRGLIRPYAERTITARAVRHADQREKSFSWRAHELRREISVSNEYDCWWRYAYKFTKEERAARVMERYYANHEQSKKRSCAAAKKLYHQRKHDPEYRAKRKAMLASWVARNPEKKKQSTKNWIAANPDKWKQCKLRARAKRQADPYCRMVYNMRARLRDLVRRGRLCHGSHHHTLIGCTRNELIKHISSLFLIGMTWANYGKWHIDHVQCIASFNLTDDEQKHRCFHYTNLAPLWGPDNIKKGSWHDGNQWERGVAVANA